MCQLTLTGGPHLFRLSDDEVDQIAIPAGWKQDHPQAALPILRIVVRKPDLVFTKEPQTQKTFKK